MYKTVFLSPYKEIMIKNNNGRSIEYVRFEIGTKYKYAKVWKITSVSSWYFSYHGQICTTPYDSHIEAMEELDKVLIEHGIKLLTQEQFDKLQVLV